MRNLFPAPFVLVYSKRFSLTKKRKYVRTKTPLCLNQNVLEFIFVTRSNLDFD